MPAPKPLSGRFNIPRAPGAPAIFASVMDGDLAAVQAILKADPDAPQARDRAGNTPLMMAVIFGPERQEIIDLLIEKGADVNAQNKHGGNVLARAAHFGHKDLVRQLLGLGADPSVKDEAGQDAAAWARMNGHDDIAALFKKPSAPKPPAP